MQNNILTALADNPPLLQALKELLREKFSLEHLTVDNADEVLGQMVRARLVGLQVVEDTFKEIKQYESVPPKPERINTSR